MRSVVREQMGGRWGPVGENEGPALLRNVGERISGEWRNQQTKMQAPRRVGKWMGGRWRERWVRTRAPCPFEEHGGVGGQWMGANRQEPGPCSFEECGQVDGQ